MKHNDIRKTASLFSRARPDRIAKGTIRLA